MVVDERVEARRAALRGGSRSLYEVLRRDEAAADLLASDEATPPDVATYTERLRHAFESGGPDALRAARRRYLLQLAALDLAGELQLEVVGRALADLADAAVDVSLAAVGAPDDLAVVAMGKLGARELNYSSDIDIMFVCSGDPLPASGAAEALLRLMAGSSSAGQMYRVDVDLRPEGRAGALVRSLDAYLEYYGRWAKPWEFQALVKARACAGALSTGALLVEETRPLVYPEEIPAERIVEIRRMKARVETHAVRSSRRGRSRTEADDVKLGPGGIRDIEFAVQLLQLVHGGADPSVREPATLDALRSLTEAGYVAEDDGAGLAVAYRWLRTVEHRLQLWQERQVHHLPGDGEGRARLARVMGFRDAPARSARDRFEDAHRAVLADVRGRFEKLFYRPLIESLAEGGPTRLSETALKERLRVLAFRDVERAARTLDGLVSGTSRRAKLFRLLTPALLRYLTATPAPDQGLFSFLTLGEALEDRVDALGALRDNPPGISFLARVLGSGRLMGELLAHVPEEVATIADPRGPGAPKARDQLVREAHASLEWRAPEARRDGLRRFKRRELVRVVLADLAGTADTAAVGAALAHLAEACLEAALHEDGPRLGVVAMGKLGGLELNYASDIDVMFVHDGDPQAAEQEAERLLQEVGAVTPEGQAFRIDAGLRPEGKAGPLARSFDSYLEYYARWAKPWEHLALLKARPAAGDVALAERLVEATRAFAFPDRLRTEAIGEIRHLKARMEKERIPRGTDPRRHLKLGPGGTADVEFSAQILQFEHGSEHPELRVQGTVAALEAAVAADLLPDEDAARLVSSYEFLARLRNRLFLLNARPADVLPVKPEELEALGIAMGFEDQPRQEVEEAYLRVTRRARRIARRVVYGEA
ncbi:MAG TPA: bifunctional [glutamine synthetase] adenylyltransferase/[glutamine synthetase]-adenylyl-L-tyrosine phosphorylase [Actinomycetota bacterium]|nr:bifunctional [glutamine synthetase] adenylyltransferase/[glutamine synthetase]-adenylyl-L-tyrosine phosphorylase [Actinomycetota bacterium]